MQSVGAIMYKAINDADIATIRSIIADYPEERDIHTFMGGQTWLGYAAQIGKSAVIATLVDLGADFNKGDRTYNASPLCSACDSGHAAVAEYLIATGAELDTATSAANPLFASIVGCSAACLKIVLRAGIDATVVYNTETMREMDAVAFALMRGERDCAVIIARWNAGGDEQAAAQALVDADAVAERNANTWNR